MVLLRLENFLTSQCDIIWLKESSTISLDNSVIAITSFELSCHIESLQFSCMKPGQWCLHFSLSGYLSPPTRLPPPITGLQYFLEYHRLVLCLKTQFLYEFNTANQPGFKPRSPRPKAATLTIKLHSIDKLTGH